MTHSASELVVHCLGASSQHIAGSSSSTTAADRGDASPAASDVGVACGGGGGGGGGGGWEAPASMASAAAAAAAASAAAAAASAPPPEPVPLSALCDLGASLGAVHGVGGRQGPSRTPSLRSTSSQIVHNLRYRISNASLFLYREVGFFAAILLLLLLLLLLLPFCLL